MEKDAPVHDPRDVTISDKILSKISKHPSDYCGIRDKTFIEARVIQAADDAICKKVTVSDSKLRKWLDPKSPYSTIASENAPLASLHLAILPHNVGSVNEQVPFKGTLESALQLLDLGSSFLFHEGLERTPSWFEIPVDDELQAFVVKPEKFDTDIAHFTLLMITNLKSHRTCGVLHFLLKEDYESFQNRLEANKVHITSPLLVPLLLLERRGKSVAPELNSSRNLMLQITKLLGTHKKYLGFRSHRRKGWHADGEEVWKRPGFEEASGQLTSMAAACLFLENKVSINLKLLAWLDEMNRGHKASQSFKSGPLHASVLMMRMKIDFLRVEFENDLFRSGYLSKWAEVQLQACTAIMSQRDNALNLKIAAASSKTASAAARDSMDMRAIGVVTLVFLPGTFTATLFSTGFFAFNPDGKLISKWFWLYCVLTVVLTSGVFGGWVFWSKRSAWVRENEISRHTE